MAYTNPRIVPHEVVNDDSLPHDEVHEINVMEYGDCYDPEGSFRVHQTPWTFDPDHDGVAK